jgi:(p)ppGpp synthase/HD superfamily hydrolase
VVALLHDVVEDGEISLDELRREFPSEIVDAIALMTHDANVDYFEHVKAIKSNTLACKVKLADLQHNSDRTRLNEFTVKDELRYQKYQKAIEILRNKEQL